MKKILFILPLMVSIFLISCSKDDDDNNNNISNTTWDRNETIEKNRGSITTKVHVELQKNTFSLSFDEYEKFSDGTSLSINHALNGTFTYRIPKLTLTYWDEGIEKYKDIEFTVFKGYISNNEYGNLNKK